MIYRKYCPEGTKMVPITYSFLEPAQVRKRLPDGTEVLMGYGIGDKIEVLEPTWWHPIVCFDKLKEIPLADGSFIIEYSDNIKVACERFSD